MTAVMSEERFKRGSRKPRYYVDFYDAFDGWCGLFGFDRNRSFDDLESAKKKCDELQASLDEPNKEMGEHLRGH